MKTFDLPITHNKLVTRADLAESLLQMLKPAAEHLNLGGGGLFIGNSSAHYSSRVALMEGWSRLLWGVAPFIARLVETSLREVDRGLIEAAQSMGASDMQIILKVLIPEAMPGIVAAITIAIITLVGYSAMAGAIGGGGLGDIGIRYGHNRYMPEVMWTVVLILVVFVQVIQSFGDWCVHKVSKR